MGVFDIVGRQKLALIVSVLAVGSFVIGPASSRLLDGDSDATRQLIAGASYDVIALAFATILSVFKPGHRFRRNEPTRKTRKERPNDAA